MEAVSALGSNVPSSSELDWPALPPDLARCARSIRLLTPGRYPTKAATTTAESSSATARSSSSAQRCGWPTTATTCVSPSTPLTPARAPTLHPLGQARTVRGAPSPSGDPRHHRTDRRAVRRRSRPDARRAEHRHRALRGAVHAQLATHPHGARRRRDHHQQLREPPRAAEAQPPRRADQGGDHEGG